MSDLGEEQFETVDDTVNAFENLLKNHYVRGLGWRREVLKRYKDGGLFIHFHAVVGRGADRWSECCEVHFHSGHSIEGPGQGVAAVDGVSASTLYKPSTVKAFGAYLSLRAVHGLYASYPALYG